MGTSGMQFLALERYRTQLGLAPSPVVPEEQSSDYESGRVEIDSHLWRVRTARVTPTKPGAFVAVWTRAPNGTTQPFSDSDECDGLIVFVEDGPRFGAFTFTREDLRQLGVVQSSLGPGKRGFRVYPPWCSGLNAQATRTQLTQSAAFADLTR